MPKDVDAGRAPTPQPPSRYVAVAERIIEVLDEAGIDPVARANVFLLAGILHNERAATASKPLR